MWLRVMLALGTVVVLAAVGLIAWRGIGIGPEETQSMSDRISANTDQVGQLQAEVKDLQAKIQTDEQKIGQLQNQVAALK